MRDETPPLTPELLLQAYRCGVFPMSESRDDPEVFWVQPRMRGVLPLDSFHISRSLAKTMRRGHFVPTLNAAFNDVVRQCADRDETWINDTIFDLYVALHERGDAHSLEIWEDNRLVGGVYGVAIGSAFFGESMFSTASNASKTALAYLTDHLLTCGFSLFDTQFITPHLTSLGAVEIPRVVYENQLAHAIQRPARLTVPNSFPTAQDVIQRNAQTS